MRHALSLALAIASLTGCGASFDLSLPERFVVLREDPRAQRGHFVMRATTPDGVVVGVKALEHRVEGSLEFWTEAITRRLRDQQGYELLAQEEIRAANGQEGVLLRFGRDLRGHAYRYTLALFVTAPTLWIVEAGGREAAYTPLEPGIESAIRAMRF